METKLTLRLDKEVVEQAKAYARKNKTSLSKMVEHYFEHLYGKKKENRSNIVPKVQQLMGIVKDNKSDKVIKQEYYESRVSKHSPKR